MQLCNQQTHQNTAEYTGVKRSDAHDHGLAVFIAAGSRMPRLVSRIFITLFMARKPITLDNAAMPFSFSA